MSDRMPLVRLQALGATILSETHPPFLRLPKVLQTLPLALRQLLTRYFQHLVSPSPQHHAARRSFCQLG